MFKKKAAVPPPPALETRRTDGFQAEAARIVEQITALQSTVGELLRPTQEAVAITTDMDKTFLAYISRAINHVISVAEVLKQTRQINHNIGDLDSHIEKQSEAVTQTSSAIEQMTASISAVSNILGENNKVMEELMGASEEGTGGIQKVTEIMKTLVTNSEVLQDASKMIQTIAAQTNLLAMNAAIEAAHAGQYGRGFAVVDNEIRKLAENCSSQGKAISKVLKNLQEEIGSATSLTGQSQEEFIKIAGLVERARQQETAIRRAMSEQETGSVQILQATHQIKEATRDVSERAKKITRSGSLILSEVSELETETAEMSKVINSLMDGIEDVEAVTGQVAARAASAGESAAHILEAVRRSGNAV